MSLRESVDITITQETRTVAVQNFGQMLVLGPNLNYTERVATVSSLAEAEELLCGGEASPEHLKIEAAFSQENAPDSVKIGAVRGTKIITDDAGTWSAGGSITATVNGTVYTQSFSTDKNTTLGALATQIAADAAVDTAVYSSGSHTITLTPNAGHVLSVTAVSVTGITGTLEGFTVTASASEDYDDALDALQLIDDEWYQLVIASGDNDDILAVSAWVEANDSPKIFGMASSDPVIVNSSAGSDSTSIAHQLKAIGPDRTVGFYHGAAARDNGSHVITAATEAIEAAVFGKIGGYAPGSYNVAYQQPAAVTPDNLNITQERNSRGYYSTGSNSSFHIAKEVNTLQTVAGFDIIMWGRTFGGSWIDFLIFKDWLIAALKAAVYGVLVNAGTKVPYDLKGYAMIEGAMETVFKTAQKNGAVPEFWYDSNGNKIPAYTITFPNIYDVPAEDFADRILNGLQWTCYYTKSINAVRMNGTFA